MYKHRERHRKRVYDKIKYSSVHLNDVLQNAKISMISYNYYLLQIKTNILNNHHRIRSKIRTITLKSRPKLKNKTF